MRRDLGDFQTPPQLVSQVYAVLKRLNIAWTRVLEPTCGRGNFLADASLKLGVVQQFQGIEKQAEHVSQARASVPSAQIHERDLFEMDLGVDLRWNTTGPLLIVGNPPWVTASELGKLESDNGPIRSNVRHLRGIEARTGRSNFDLAEAALLKLIVELGHESPTIALLCKATVARNLIELAQANGWPLLSGSFHRIDARHWFKASVEAGLLRLTLGAGTPRYEIDDFLSLDATTVSRRLGVVDGMVVNDLDSVEASHGLFGREPRPWRQGVKHDAARVLELVHESSHWRNGIGERVDVEEPHVFPLMKATDLDRPERAPRRGLIVVQTSLGENVDRLAESAPRLWTYLNQHAEVFALRKSSIYKQRPSFSIFGVGPYTFANHKVAVSGLHRVAKFRQVGPVDGLPVVFDDASYFLPCESPEEAGTLAEGLNGPEAQALIQALTSTGMKRPITKRLLQRIQLKRLATCLDSPTVT